MAPGPHSVVFLVDVDNTLLDNDCIRTDIRRHFEHELGVEVRDRYWAIQEQLFVDLGYRDYLGALQRALLEEPREMGLLAMSSYLLDYPFAERVYPGALEVLGRFREWGTTVALTDGDAVYQARKVARSGIAEAVGGEILMYIHKEDELDDVATRYPADRYVVVDDKLRILAAVKQSWGERVTTVFPRQGQFADDQVVAEYAPADITVERVGDLLACELPDLLAAASS